MSDTDKDTDAVTGIETTGHEWDGIKELNNPLPRWWLWTFYLTIIWAVGYAIAYPALPLVSGAPRGLLDYSSREAVHEKMAAAREAQADLHQKIESLPVAEIRQNPDAYQFAVNGGRAAFAVNCSQCHGSGAQGSPGYPNLNDDDWLWGGSLQAIQTTIQHGIRFAGDDDSRYSEMPAFGRDGLLNHAQIVDAANYVRKLAGLEHDSAAAEAGMTVFEENCAACHKSNGVGDREQGAPNLTDAIWHYGSSLDAVTRQISNPKHGVMPAWGGRLDAATIKELTLFVHSLGGGE